MSEIHFVGKTRYEDLTETGSIYLNLITHSLAVFLETYKYFNVISTTDFDK